MCEAKGLRKDIDYETEGGGDTNQPFVMKIYKVDMIMEDLLELNNEKQKQHGDIFGCLLGDSAAAATASARKL